jgi:hypothetical protein
MLTGLTREHAFMFIFGPGGNGKGVLVNTLAAALGDYAVSAPMETFMATTHERHPTDLAGLRGARLVIAQETDAGRALAEAKLKALTGGDRISARYMRGDFFEYVPAFKLVMVGNHRPLIRNPDDAMRRRLHLLPLTFRPGRPDHELADRLRAELPGILAWAIEGCLSWQREGLGRRSACHARAPRNRGRGARPHPCAGSRERPSRRARSAVAALHMPVVAIVSGVLIVFYFNDHDPAHFHAIAGDDEMRVRIADLAVIEGGIPPAKRRAVLAWARANQDALALAWVRCRDGLAPGKIGG